MLEQQPQMALFLTIAIGYILGEITVKGFSLGVGAVLFVALGVGWLAPRSSPPAAVGNVGLALFLYAVGIHYGEQFFNGLRSAKGLRANLIALTGVLLAASVSVLFVKMLGLRAAYALGLFAGAGTSTPTLQAAITALGHDDPAVGYSVAYPFGVAGPILFLYATFAVMKPTIDVSKRASFELLEIAVRRSEFLGRRLIDVISMLPADVRIVALRRNDHNQPASPDIVIAENDVLLAVAPSRATLDRLLTTLGEAAPGRIAQDRRDLDYLQVFASRPGVVGVPLGDLTLPGDRASAVLHIRRGDADLHALPGLVLEYGDRVGLLAHRADFPVLRQYFGDSIRGTAELSYVSIGLGLALGCLVGAIGVPLGAGHVSLGMAGVLIVGLSLGKLRRTAALHWVIPVSANLVLRNLGLTLFLAQVGMSSGPTFAATVAENGLQMLGLGAVVLVALTVPILLIGLMAFRVPFDEVAGIIAGACGNPAILAYANRLAPTENPDLGYAIVFPSMTIVKILVVGVAAVLL
jgi:putative transport protein